MPFTFLDGDVHVDQLISTMRNCGFASVDLARSTDPYFPATMRFRCLWLPDSELELVISTRWWDDGETPEDSSIELVQDGRTTLSLDVQSLLGEKLDVPLRDLLLSKISEFACGISGKRSP